jgi:hypothetical protein
MILIPVLAGLFLLAVRILLVSLVRAEMRHARAFHEETQRMVKAIEQGTWNGDWKGKEW